MTKQEDARQPTATNLSLGFIVLCLVVYVLHMARVILIPFFIAVFVWYLINAVARALSRVSVGGVSLSRFLCYALTILGLVFGMWVVFEIISQNLTKVVHAAPHYQRTFEQVVIPKVVSLFHLEYAPTIRDLFEYVNLGATMTMLAKMFTGFAGKTLVVMFYVGFLLYEQQFFDRKIINMIRDKKREERLRGALKNIDNKIQRYIGVKSFVSLIDSFLTFSILSFFHVDFAGFWGLMAFFLHFIPYAGSFIAISLPTLIALIQHGDLSLTFGVLACLSVSHAFLGHVLDPYLMGDNLNLSPIFIISSLAVWGMIWGVPGMFLAIPILAMIAITLSQFPVTRPISVLLSKTGELESVRFLRLRRFRRKKSA